LNLKLEQTDISNITLHNTSLYSKLIENNYFRLLVSLFAFSIPALSMIINSGYSIGAVLLSIVALIYLPKLDTYFQELQKDDKILIVTLASYFLIFSISIVLDGFHTREFDRPSRFLLASLALIILLKTRINVELVLYGVIIGAAGTGFLAIYQYFVLGMDRPSGFQIVIAFGNDSLLLALLALSSMGVFLAQKKYLIVALSLVAATLALSAFIFSGTRGGWLATPLIILVLWQYRKKLNPVALLSITSIIFALVIAMLLSPKLGTLDRLKLINTNLDNYFSGQDVNTSTGLRFEMWKSALYSFREKPIFGTGEYGNKAYKEQQIQQGLVSSKIITFGHAHNEIFTALSHRGLIGFLSLLCIYLVPLWLFSKVLFSKQSALDPRTKMIALGGCLIPLSYFIYGLTQTMFDHNSGSTIYPFFIVIYWAAMRGMEQHDRNTEATDDLS
jgi:O-antigen ligase